MVRVGQKLHDTRMRKSLTVDEVAAATKIRPRFVEAIERGEYDKLPSAAYAQGFVSNYAQYLGLSQKEIMALFRREFDGKRVYKVLPESLTKNDSLSLPRIHIQQSVVVISIVLLALFAYLGFQYRAMFTSPALELSSPKQNAAIKGDVIVSGKTDPSATVLVNNESVTLNKQGEFTKNITLFPGKSLITVKAKNRFGREAELQRSIDVK
jgi:cytoskeletal protein RodZ